ncbi:MAG: glycoside hydrolase family 88 protein [Deltaproteobacteria bacterium]|nr:glycoside hydrolase family 88 protein [Deltaproteobacteria bacterium]
MWVYTLPMHLSALLSVLLACAPPEAPAAHDTLPIAQALATQGMTRWPAESLPLDWMQTVWATGLLGVHEVDPSLGVDLYLQEWLDDELPRFTADPPKEFNSSDSMSPAMIAAALETLEPTGRYTPILDAADRYLSVARYAENGAIQHWGDGSVFEDLDQVWVDSMFMVGVTALNRHDQTGDDTFLESALTQHDAFVALLVDPNDGLYRHAYDVPTGENIPAEAVYWARGNSWALLMAVETYARLPQDHPGAEALGAAFVAHAEAVLNTQAEDGLWPTVLTATPEDGNYTETSAAALIVTALMRGVDLGLLDPTQTNPAIDRAIDGLLGRVEQDAEGAWVVEGTSFGTNPGDYDYYLSVAQLDDIILGVGAVALAFAEADGRPRAETP